VILEFKMPKLDRCTACAQIRRLPGYGDIPIVIPTAFDNEIARAAAKQAGATAFITRTTVRRTPMTTTPANSSELVVIRRLTVNPTFPSPSG
jgi:CheY-like chemotaxis protein